MTTLQWIVVAISVLFVLGFIGVMRSQLRANRKLDAHIDYSKVKPWVDDEEEDDWGKK